MIGDLIPKRSRIRWTHVLALLAATSAACTPIGGGDDPGHNTAALPATPTAPTTIAAGDMTTKTTGAEQGDVYNIWSNGYISNPVSFPSAGTYTFDVSAFGSVYRGGWPTMEVRADGAVIASIDVSSATLAHYTATAQLAAGVHQIAIAFTNDAGGGGQDRNLYVSSIAIAGGSCTGGTTTSIQASNMTTKTTGAQQGDAYNIWSDGYISSSVSFPSSGSYAFDVAAFGSMYQGVGPNMEIRSDGVVLASIDVRSTEVESYSATAQIDAGTHEIAIAFTNDDGGGGEDRNLFVESLTITGGSCGSGGTGSGGTGGGGGGGGNGTFDVAGFLSKYVPGTAHEGLVDGVPLDYSWSQHSEAPELTAPAGTGWANWWAQAGVDTTAIRPANTRIEYRAPSLWVLPTGSNTWVQYFATAGIDGDGFLADFSGACASYSGVSLGTNALSLAPLAGCFDHFWSVNPAFVELGGSIRAAISIASVRLILNDPNGPDDRADSHYLLGMGGDWRSPDGDCPTNVFGQLSCNGIDGGIFIYPKTFWRAAVMTTMSPSDLQTLPLPPVEAFVLPDGSYPTE